MKNPLMHPALNFFLTNRLPRTAVTIFFGRLSRIRNRWLTRFVIRVWKRFSDLDLSDARKQHFQSLHDCFVRELKPGARPIDVEPGAIISPCDAIIGAHGTIKAGLMLQAKGQRYSLEDLLGADRHSDQFSGARYVTLRLTAQMYHRFHSPASMRIHRVDYISGDCWNVNPPALDRVPRLFCRNERAIINAQLSDTGEPIVLVAVAAILVASIRLRFADVLLHLRYRGSNPISCNHDVTPGEELGWFEHGSTIILIAPGHFDLASHWVTGNRIRMGQVLLRATQTSKRSE